MKAFETAVYLLAAAAIILFFELVKFDHSRLFALACAGTAFGISVCIAFHACAYLFGVNDEPDE